MSRLITWFLRGLIYLVPIALTVWVFVASFRAIDGLLGLPIPGVGLLVLVVLVTLFGFLLSNYLSSRILQLFEKMIDRLPLVKLLHTSLKDLMGAFVGDRRRFDTPVMVELLPGSGVYTFGFVTRASLLEYGLPAEFVAVYFPQAYNVAGQIVAVPRERVQSLKIDSAEMMAFIVSGGVAGKSG